ncbi:MAG: DDE-type integrase/transposase/recombinase [Nitrospira sp.]|nr:DDE-type integrase/transposase/recombinase [Nitrospira sp.]
MEGWLYLAVLLDLYFRRVGGWAMDQRLTVELAEQAFMMALTNQTPRAGFVHHSDRGGQYAATNYQHRLAEYGLIFSMGRKSYCWDNACVKSFFGTLKRELVYHGRYATQGEAKQKIFEYIEVFYNR